MEKLHIDIETYSDAELSKTGVFRYVADPSFEVLLFAYSVDGAPVQIIDLAQGETLPEDILRALTDPDVLKYAYNAPFEYACLSKVYGGTGVFEPSQWRCVMMHGLYGGYTAGLEATGKALGLEEDKQKLKTGKALIRYFCKPCKPTKSNGGRTRNLPHHEPEKWELFKDYCRQDVVTEMAVEERLSAFPVPDFVQKQWETDLVINTRGVAVDEALVQSALDVGKEVKADLLAEAGRITGITNPNSVPQLAAWLSAQGVDVPDLRKDTVAELLKQKDLAPPVRRMLEIRRELGKTSTKKYDAITACLCPDGRVRGLLQFYGASRSGRWAGRLIQMQNLPRTHLAALDLARELTRGRKTGALKLIYGNVPDTLSQLIRTAFIAAPGHRLVDADFSAIEARVLSWLAGEEWRLEVFRTHGKIYEASASQMFKVPIERIKKGNPEYELRAKGKVAELALGYQGSEGALISMGALDMGLTEQELPGIVSAWRSSNSRIRNLWGTLQTAAERVLRDGGHQVVNIEGSAQLVFRLEHDRAHDIKAMSIRLPSGRKLYYVDPQMGENRFGGTSITYMGVSNAKKWTRLETYGGKLVENCTQAIARDALAEAIERLEAAGYPIIFHIHDEVVIDIEPFEPDEDMLRRVVRIMAAPMPWAPGLPLNADGWVGDYFTKD